VKQSPLFEKALRGYEKSAAGEWERYNCQSLLGWSLAGQKKYAEAEPLVTAAYEGILQREATIPVANRRVLAEAGQRVCSFYQDWGKPDKASEWKQRLGDVK